MIISRRTVDAGALLQQTADLRGYPYRFLSVHATGVDLSIRVTMLTAAVEILENYGWDLVSTLGGDSYGLIAMLRRRGEPGAE
jgi:hypothetical protein